MIVKVLLLSSMIVLAAACAKPPTLTADDGSTARPTSHVVVGLRVDTFGANRPMSVLRAARAKLSLAGDFVELFDLELEFVPPANQGLPGKQTKRTKLRSPLAHGDPVTREFNIFGPAQLIDPDGQKMTTAYAWYSGESQLLVLPGGGRFAGPRGVFDTRHLVYHIKSRRYYLTKVSGTIRPQPRKSAK